MQTRTKSKVRVECSPFEDTTSAPRANGTAKSVCEHRIKRRKRSSALPDRASPAGCRSCKFTGRSRNHFSADVANAHWRRKESVCRAQTAFARLAGSGVPIVIAEVAFRLGNISGEEQRNQADRS